MLFKGNSHVVVPFGRGFPCRDQALGVVYNARGRRRRSGGAPQALELAPKDHISIIGNTLADRMQHDGWLETYLQSRFPKHDLVIRNLGFSGDELTIRLRSANFGTPDEWLTRTKTDVVFAFFGYNESFAGEAGSASSRRTSTSFIKHTLGQKYNGKAHAAAGPVLADRPRGPARPQPARRQREQRAARALHRGDGRGRQGEQRPFVDLFHPTRELYAKAQRSRSRSTAST